MKIAWGGAKSLIFSMHSVFGSALLGSLLAGDIHMGILTTT
jgi:hypothetical protein